MLPRPLRLRQDHAAAGDRGARRPDRGRRRAGGRRHLRASAFGARLRDRLPVLCAVPEHDRRAQCRLRTGEPGTFARGDPGSGAGAAGAGRPPRPGRQVPRPALGRAAAAHRARAGHRDLARPAAARRAALRPRREGEGAAAPRGEGAATPARRHHHHGHPRPGRGADHGGSHRGDERRRDRAGRDPDRDLPRAREHLRHRLHRRHELHRRGGHRRRGGRGRPARTNRHGHRSGQRLRGNGRVPGMPRFVRPRRARQSRGAPADGPADRAGRRHDVRERRTVRALAPRDAVRIYAEARPDG